MSLILEALRKSEAERRRGQAPDLLTEAAPTVPAARASSRARHLIPLAAGGTVLVAVVLVWFWSRSPAEPNATGTAAVAASTARAADAPIEPPRPLQPPRVPPAVAPPAPIPTVAAAAVAKPPVAQPIAADTPAHSDHDPRAHSDIAEPARAAPSPPPVAGFSSPDLPLRLSELSTDERQQLPPLKVSMHMWAQEADDRFAIIDGTRVNEGDRIGEATVEAIQQDGVTLAWRGRRISLPIR